MDKINYALIRFQVFWKISIQQEKEELKEYIKEMWGYSFGELFDNLPFRLYWIPLILLFVICGIGLGGVLSLWALAHPIILMIYLFYVLFYLVYVIHYRLTDGKSCEVE